MSPLPSVSSVGLTEAVLGSEVTLSVWEGASTEAPRHTLMKTSRDQRRETQPLAGPRVLELAII